MQVIEPMTEEELSIWRSTYAATFADLTVLARHNSECTERAVYAADAAVRGLRFWRLNQNFNAGVGVNP